MPRPGFYNDNEYREYPFIYETAAVNEPGAGDPAAAVLLPNSAIVDAGFILGLDALFDDETNSVWLSSVQRVNNVFRFTFSTDATRNPPLVFEQDVALDEWAIAHAESAVGVDLDCAEEPVWEGFIVTGPLQALRAALPSNGTLTFNKDVYQIEPGRLQNLHKSYLRSISVGNYDRVRVPPCGQTSSSANRDIVANALCLKGDIRLKEGYNCQITQTDRANEILVTAVKGGGEPYDAALCVAGSELPLYVGEQLAAGSKFYSGGPACDELIATINGIGGPNVTILGGAGIEVRVENGKIKIQQRPNAQVTCT
jgi:hypothetical protein